jgi:DNA glycosylase AlkZ-like
VWTVPAPEMDEKEARLELARRYLSGFGPGTPAGFGDWAGIRPERAKATFDDLATETLPARSPTGEGWILASDEPSFRAGPSPAAAARLLPSGDTWFLLQGADRSLLVPDATLRPLLWTPRVWPGALLIDGEVAGTWRRANADVTVSLWRRLSAVERQAVEAEAASMPIPGSVGQVTVRWDD